MHHSQAETVLFLEELGGSDEQALHDFDDGHRLCSPSLNHGLTALVVSIFRCGSEFFAAGLVGSVDSLVLLSGLKCFTAKQRPLA